MWMQLLFSITAIVVAAIIYQIAFRRGEQKHLKLHKPATVLLGKGGTYYMIVAGGEVRLRDQSGPGVVALGRIEDGALSFRSPRTGNSLDVETSRVGVFYRTTPPISASAAAGAER
jgi:hypothetical protein